MKTPEAKIKAYARKRLRALGAYVFSPVQMGYGMPTLDLCCLNGRFVGIEYKQQGKEPTKRQYITMKQMKAAGGIAFGCDSIEAFEEALKFYNLLPPVRKLEPAAAELGQEANHDDGHDHDDGDLNELPGGLGQR